MFATNDGDYVHMADLRPVLRSAIKTIEQLAEQQAMPDEFYRTVLSDLEYEIR